MLQRIQTLFLLGVVVSMGLLLFLPLWEGNAPSGEISIEALSITKGAESENTYLIGVLAFLSIVVAFASIFMFKNRHLQLKLNALNSLIISGTIAAIVYVIFDIKSEAVMEEQYKLGCALPIVALVMNVLATRFIKKDEDLIRSMDRIR